MDERKVIQSGNFSYTISLPKDWVVRHKIAKGSKVFVGESANNLIISPENKNGKSFIRKEYSINVDGILPSIVIRDITAAYLTNSSSIRLYGKDLPKFIKQYKEAAQKHVGLEVIEETSSYVIFKDFVNLSELNIVDIVKRIDIVIQSLFEDNLECLSSQNKDLAEAIIKRDGEINRLVYLIFKCLNYITECPHEASNHGIETPYTNSVWELVTSLEKIGDGLKRFARIIPDQKIDTKDKKIISGFVEEVREFYLEVISSLYKGKTIGADTAADRRYLTTKKMNDYLSKSKSMHIHLLVTKLAPLISAINSTSRILRYIGFDKHTVVSGKVVSEN